MPTFTHEKQTFPLNFDQSALIRYHRNGGDLKRFFQDQDLLEATSQFLIAIHASSPEHIRKKYNSEDFIVSLRHIPANSAQEFTKAIQENWMGIPYIAPSLNNQ